MIISNKAKAQVYREIASLIKRNPDVVSPVFFEEMAICLEEEATYCILHAEDTDLIDNLLHKDPAEHPEMSPELWAWLRVKGYIAYIQDKELEYRKKGEQLCSFSGDLLIKINELKRIIVDAMKIIPPVNPVHKRFKDFIARLEEKPNARNGS